ncbi:MAG TPA: hypothetical protein VKB38_18725 [Terracidiphilus sp.]|nr:hypothetical protein [Terracidiphilus sp.]
MIIELKPEFQEILERAARAGLSREEVLDQAFAAVEEQIDSQEWMIQERETIERHVEEGCAQADRGELIDAEDAVRLLKERRARRNVA